MPWNQTKPNQNTAYSHISRIGVPPSDAVLCYTHDTPFVNDSYFYAGVTVGIF